MDSSKFEMTGCLSGLTPYLEEVPKGAAISEYLAWLNDKVQNKEPLYISDYEPIVRAEEASSGGDRPFLSVVTRTQGKRDEMLRETFLSLAGQEDQDFEVILVGHKVNEEQDSLLKEIIEEQPDYMRKKIRYYQLDHGNRTTPLNFGFAHARGEYIAILDDDDIVLDNWVSSFHKTAEKRPGAVLYAAVYYQDWMTINTESGKEALRTCGAPIYNMFSWEFNFFEQLRVNNCPAIGIAFPSYLFRKFGIIFDESLSTTEDWDYLQRCVFVAGIENVHEETSIYRFWKNAGSSKTEHERAEWDRNHLRVLDKFLNMPILIPEDEKKSLSRETMKAIQHADWPYRLPRIQFSTLYIDRGDGFSQNDIITSEFISNGMYFDSAFVMPVGKEKPAIRLRFDPGEEGMFVIERVVMLLEYEDGSKEMRNMNGTITNGLNGNEKVFFLKNDPWIIWDDIKKPLKFVRIVGKMTTEITDEMLDDFINVSCTDKNSVGGKIHSILSKLRGR